MKLRFSIIIVHFNGFERLNNLIKGLLSDISDNDRIIVIDNNSSDNSIDLIKKEYSTNKIHLIENKFNRGYSVAANQGIHYQDSKYVLVCNNDIVTEKGTLKKLESLFIKFPETAMISGQLVDSKNQISSTVSGEFTFLSNLDGIDKIARIKQPRKIQESFVDNLRGACLAVRRKAIDQVGGYNEKFFFYFEDTEWCVRLRNKGWKILFSPSIQIFHEGGGSTSKYFLKSRIEFLRSRIYLCQISFSKPQLTFLALWNIPKLFLDWIFYFVLSLLSLFTKKKYTDKFLERSLILCWLCIGLPKSWGLPRNYSGE